MSSDNDHIYIFVYDKDDDQIGDSLEPTDFPTPDPLGRNTDFRKCTKINEKQVEDSTSLTFYAYNNSIQELFGVALIDFVYSIQVESVREAVELSTEGEQVLLTSLSNAILESMYDNECGFGRNSEDEIQINADPDNGSRHLRNSRHRQIQRTQLLPRRRLAIQSISPGSGHRILGACPDQKDLGSTNITNMTEMNFLPPFEYTLPSCGYVQGTVLVGFDTLGDYAYSFRSVGTTVLSRIEQDMQAGLYLAHVNEELQAYQVQVTETKFLQSDYLENIDGDVFASPGSLDRAQSHSSLSTFALITIPIIVLLFLILLCVFWCSYSKPLGKRFAVRNYGNGHENDFSAVANSHLKPCQKPKVAETRQKVEAPPNNLVHPSRCIDVAHCNKPECRLCRHRNKHRAVSMIGELSKDLGGDEDAPLETTLEDFEGLQQKVGVDTAPAKTYSTVPHLSRSSFNLSGPRFPSLIRNGTQDKHDKKDFCNEPRRVSFADVELVKPRSISQLKQGKRKLEQIIAPSPSSPKSHWNFLSSVFGDNQNEDVNDLGDCNCDPRNLSFSESESDDYSDDGLDLKHISAQRTSTIDSYISKNTQTNKSSDAEPLDRAALPFRSTLTEAITAKTTTISNDDSRSSQKTSLRDSSSFRLSNERHQPKLQRQHSTEESVIVRDGRLWIEAYKDNWMLPHSPRRSSMRIVGTSKNYCSPDRKTKAEQRRVQMRRQQSLNDMVQKLPVGRKRTLTDDSGLIREEVSL